MAEGFEMVEAQLLVATGRNSMRKEAKPVVDRRRRRVRRVRSEVKSDGVNKCVRLINWAEEEKEIMLWEAERRWVNEKKKVY